jgi:hypothetical protein
VKPKYPESKLRRIILLYALAVLLPGILLGIMAWQGIRNDQARREKEGRLRLQSTRDAFCQAMDSTIVASMKLLSLPGDTAIDHYFPDFVKLAFRQTSQNDPTLLKHHLLYLPDSTNPTISGLPERSPEFFQATGLEQMGRDLAKARQLFQPIAQKSKNRNEQMDACLALARISKKLNLTKQALADWTQVEKQFPADKMNGKIPLKLIAMTEKAKIFKDLNQHDSLTTEISTLFQFLANPSIIYEAVQYRFFKNLLESLYAGGNPLADSLKLILQSRQEETDFYIRLILERKPLFMEQGSKPQDILTGLHRIPFIRAEESFLFLTSESVDGERSGMVLDITELVMDKAGEVMKRLDPTVDLSWILSDQNQKAVVNDIHSIENQFIGFNLTADFPGWEIRLKENEMSWFDGLLSKGNGTYLLIFVFIALIMALGLIFTLYTLNQELQLNRLKTDFIANVSHELKSPLTSIRHLMDLLHTNRVKTAEQRKKYYATMIGQSF